MTSLSNTKKTERTQATSVRRRLARDNVGANLIHLFPSHFKQSIIAGFSPIRDEIDVWPLLKTLSESGRRIVLPVVTDSGRPLIFREWSPGCPMATDRYDVSYPVEGEALRPHLVLVPLLAFTAHGERLGYGGGYYDRTLEALRKSGEVFACGVAYAGQEVAELPTDAHDAKLDGILTEQGFKAFT